MKKQKSTFKQISSPESTSFSFYSFSIIYQSLTFQSLRPSALRSLPRAFKLPGLVEDDAPPKPSELSPRPWVLTSCTVEVSEACNMLLIPMTKTSVSGFRYAFFFIFLQYLNSFRAQSYIFFSFPSKKISLFFRKPKRNVFLPHPLTSIHHLPSHSTFVILNTTVCMVPSSFWRKAFHVITPFSMLPISHHSRNSCPG